MGGSDHLVDGVAAVPGVSAACRLAWRSNVCRAAADRLHAHRVELDALGLQLGATAYGQCDGQPHSAARALRRYRRDARWRRIRSAQRSTTNGGSGSDADTGTALAWFCLRGRLSEPGLRL